MIVRRVTRLLALGSLASAIFLWAPALSAQASGTIAQGFAANSSQGTIVSGALVSLKQNTQSVELATADNVDQLVGVADQHPLVVISGSSQEAQVVLGGATDTLVSDINGTIKAGDRITASPVAGVGMKATTTTRVVGIAQTDFDVAHAQSQDITDSAGGHHTIHIGHVTLQISLANYQAPGSGFLPPFLQDVANNVAGKQVSIIRVLICSVLLLVSMLTLALFTFSSARSAMISIGRNPLASAHIRSSLYQVGAIAFAALGAVLLACYFILTL